MSHTPKLSIIVVCYRMQEQIRNTIKSLSPDYQRGVNSRDYEVLLLENSSDQPMEQADIASLPDNFRHILRIESSVSPAAAINGFFRVSYG